MHGPCMIGFGCLDKLNINCGLSNYQTQGEQIQHKMPYVIPAQRILSADS